MAGNNQIVFSGGGTGGHVMPLVAVAKQLSKLYPKVKIYELSPEASPALTQLGVIHHHVSADKLRRYLSLKNLLTPFKLLRGIRQAKEILSKLQPSLVFAKGGYATVPVVQAAHQLAIPVILHESDIVLGLATRRLAKSARMIGVGFPKTLYPKKFLPKIVYTGIPLKEEFNQSATFPKEARTILVTGGSQGALRINQLIWEILPELVNHFQVIHITGPAHLAIASHKRSELQLDQRNRYEIYGFVENNMRKLIERASLVITRGGATSLCEIAATSRPALVIPLSGAAGNHQVKNAAYFANLGGMIVLNESQTTSQHLAEKIHDLMADPGKLALMGQKNLRQIVPNSTEIVAEIIAKSAGLK